MSIQESCLLIQNKRHIDTINPYIFNSALVKVSIFSMSFFIKRQDKCSNFVNVLAILNATKFSESGCKLTLSLLYPAVCKFATDSREVAGRQQQILMIKKRQQLVLFYPYIIFSPATRSPFFCFSPLPPLP